MHHTMHYCPWNIEQPADCGSNNIVPFPRTAPARKCGVAFVLIARKELGFRVHHLEFAAIVIEFDLAVKRHASADGEAIGKIRSVEPLAKQCRARSIGEDSFEEAEIAAAEKALANSKATPAQLNMAAQRLSQLRTSATMVASSPGASWEIGLRLLRSS